jgi:hypothetical protein
MEFSVLDFGMEEYEFWYEISHGFNGLSRFQSAESVQTAANT